MKVSVLTHTYPRFRGDINAPFVESLTEKLASNGNDISLITAFDPEWKRISGDHTIDLRTYKYIWPDRFHILGYSRTIEGNVRFRKRVMLLSPFLFAGSFAGFLNLVKEKKPDILHAHWILPNGFIAGAVSRLTGIPLLIQLHGSDVFTAEKNPLFRQMARFAGKTASYIVSPSPDLRERLGRIGIDTKKIGIVPNCVEKDFGESLPIEKTELLKKDLGVEKSKKIILALGRMVYVKGFDYLLRAFAMIADKYPDTTLILAGDGVLYGDMKRLAADLGIADRVKMPGALNRDMVPLYFSLADIFVVPSIKHESGAVDGLPVVVPEAMAAGLPIVASSVGGIPVLVRDGVTGRLVKERDVDGLSEAISFFIENANDGKEYGKTAKKIIREKINYDYIASHINKIYNEIVFEKRAGRDISAFNIFENRDL